MSCLAMLELASEHLSSRKQKQLARITRRMAANPRCNEAVQRFLAHRYEKATGKRLPTNLAAFDWEKLLAWFLENAGALLTLLVSLITIFV